MGAPIIYGLGDVVFKWTCPNCNKVITEQKRSSWKPVCVCGTSPPAEWSFEMDTVDGITTVNIVPQRINEQTSKN